MQSITKLFLMGLIIMSNMNVSANHNSTNSEKLLINEAVLLCQNFFATNNWQNLIKDIIPIKSGCGLIYDLQNVLNLQNGDLAIADMRSITFSEPHYHPTGHTEIYYVLQGTAKILVAGIEHSVKKSDILIIEPNKAHFTIPDKNFVIAVMNVPAFTPDAYIPLYKSNSSVGFDLDQFNQLIRMQKSDLKND